MIDPEDMPTPDLAERFVLEVALAPPIVVGTLATGGVRAHRTATGGRLTGEGVDAVLVGGGETVLHRPDGVGVLEASLLVRDAGGAVIRVVGTGYTTIDAPFAGTRMTIVFEVDEGSPYAALSTRAFVGERVAGDDRYTIAEIV